MRRLLTRIELILFLSMIFPISNVVAQVGFEQSRQSWLSRDGASPMGGFDSGCHAGRTYLLAWLEKNISFDSKLIQDLIKPCVNKTSSNCPDPDSNIPTRSGSAHHVTLARIYYQYYDQLDQSLRAEIEAEFSSNSTNSTYVYVRPWTSSTQPIYLPVMLLWTQINDKDATVEFRESDNDVSFTSSYSGKFYQNGVGIRYNTYEFTRDWLFHAYDTWANLGSTEMDGNYTHHIINCGLLLYDFADRAGVSPANDGMAIKNRSKMMLDLMVLDMGLEFSARQHGGSRGREYIANTLSANIRWYYEPFNGVFTNAGYTYRDGYAYVSTYRVPFVINDAIRIDDEPADYWHITMQNNRAGSDPGYVFVTPYFNLGGTYPKGTDWMLNILSNDGNGPKEGQPFMLFIDSTPHGADVDYMDSQNIKVIETGKANVYQYHNAAFLKGVGDNLHVVKGNFTFDDGESNLLPGGNGYKNDYTINGDWNFFLENKTAIALKKDGTNWGMEVVVIDNSVSAEHVYPTFQAFKDAVLENAELASGFFTTSRGHVITNSNTGGQVDGNEIWPSDFKRIECYDHKGNTIVEWNETGKIGVMTVRKNGKESVYNFNNWTYTEDGQPVDITPPGTPEGISVSQ